MNLVPMFRYSKVWRPDKKIAETGNDTRLWALVRVGLHTTAEFAVVLSHTRDFCGARYISSPQVSVYTTTDGSKYTSNRTFCNPFRGMYMSDSTKKVPCSWPILREYPTRALDLCAFTDTTEADWDETTLTDYGMKCMAAAVLTELLSSNKHSWVSADLTNGRMSQLHRTMVEMQESVPGTPVLQGNGVLGGEVERVENYTEPLLFDYEVVDGRCPEWVNANSGNNVQWLIGYLKDVSVVMPNHADMPKTIQGKCMYCGSQMKLNTEAPIQSRCGHCRSNGSNLLWYVSCLPKKFQALSPRVPVAEETFNDVNYYKQARYFMWRNG